MKITMIDALKIPMEVEQIICRHDQIKEREKAWDRKGYECIEIKQIDRYTTLMRFTKTHKPWKPGGAS